MLVCLVLTAGSLNNAQVISNVPATFCIDLPFCALHISQCATNSKHVLPPTADIMPTCVTWHPVKEGFYDGLIPSASQLCLGHLSSLGKIHI